MSTAQLYSEKDEAIVNLVANENLSHLFLAHLPSLRGLAATQRTAMKPKLPRNSALWVLPLTITAVFSQTTPSETTELEALTVTAQADPAAEGYLAPETTTGALKAPAPLLETPQAVSVISEQLIQDQDSVKLEEVLRNVAGISTGGYYGSYDQYRIRGFEGAYKTYWDGLRGDSGTSPEMYGMEKVEVIKGPASALYGNAPLGGLVNIVSKRPKYDT
ncbi:MAG: hypothetical protein EOP85_21365, partial [Verrucomicrobiaceae bacterium]